MNKLIGKNISSERFAKKYANYILLFIILLIFFLIGQFKRSRLKECHKFSVGKIIGVLKGGPGLASGTKYIYFVNKKQYEGIIVKRYYNLKNNKFPVIYKCDEPDFSKMLIEPNDFKEFGYKYPDSLKWVLKYIENKQ